ncbi:DUF6916 family protein [Metapseudomonas otitidis]|uniref:DUF6916 family protein n=1 Tax=Metapseudomonas otitidis TaxID=319939 RepID=UPI002097AFCA|nr:hypothetical protein [Pseudomonas otitidis]MCO7553840.1 hypothetical protein [Pseudomonas otitidis]
MSAFTDQTHFQQYLGQDWQVVWEGGAVTVTLVEVNTGVPMNARYTCFDLVFVQPAGYQLPQHTYSLQSPSGEQLTDVLLSPIGPEEDGDRHLLQAIFHVRTPVPTS